MNKIKQELSSMDIAQLQDKVNSLRNELFVLRLNSSTAHIKDYSQFKKMRKNLACALTYLNQKIVMQRVKLIFEQMGLFDEEQDAGKNE